MKLDVINLDSQNVGQIDLADEIFGMPVRADILHRMVNWQLARRQRGTHKTKGVSEISGTTKKPFNQKGGGRARQGSAASVDTHKTKELAARFKKLGWASVLVVDGAAVNESFARAARNIPHVDVLPQQGANVYDILRRDTLVLTKDAVQALEARLK